jgi:hypothetical protein
VFGIKLNLKQTHKSKNPSANAGVFSFSVVARGGIEPGPRKLNPRRDFPAAMVQINPVFDELSEQYQFLLS